MTEHCHTSYILKHSFHFAHKSTNTYINQQLFTVFKFQRIFQHSRLNIKNHYSQTSINVDTHHKSLLRFNNVPASVPLIDVAGWWKIDLRVNNNSVSKHSQLQIKDFNSCVLTIWHEPILRYIFVPCSLYCIVWMWEMLWKSYYVISFSFHFSSTHVSTYQKPGTGFIGKSTSREILKTFIDVAGVPDSRDVLGPLSVKCFCPFLKLIQLILDHFHFFTVSTLFCHGLQSKQIKWVRNSSRAAINLMDYDGFVNSTAGVTVYVQPWLVGYFFMTCVDYHINILMIIFILLFSFTLSLSNCVFFMA